MSKVIVYCADGTWNGAGHSSVLEKDKPELSNVYRLYQELRGRSVGQVDGGLGLWAEEKEDVDPDGTVRQVAMYGHGVGENTHNLEEHVVGGAFGGGLTTRIRLGYAFISARFRPGDAIVIIGFSRGAYAARALADMIASQGLLPPELAAEHHTLSWAAGAWLLYRASSAEANVASAVRESEAFHRKALEAVGRIPSKELLVPAKVDAIGVFDTVGSVGLPHFKSGSRHDDFGFVSTELLLGIRHAFHAVSLDEQRANFLPTFWLTEGDERLTQMLFPGAHSDVGGGYDQHGLADVTLEWMFQKLEHIVAFNDTKPSAGALSPDPLGLAHQPWRTIVAGIAHSQRNFDLGPFAVSDAVRARIAAPAVEVEGEGYVAYDPKNLPRREGHAPVIAVGR